MLKSDKSLAEALRERAEFLNQYPNTREYSWGDNNSVVAALYEFADVVDSWSGEYLSKELTYEENQRRRWSNTHWKQTEEPPMTMEERRAAVKKEQSCVILNGK
jgi:hypothetical protein